MCYSLNNVKGSKLQKKQEETKPMLIKRPEKDAKFKYTINCIFNVKPYSLTLDKKPHKHLPHFTLLTPSLKTPSKIQNQKVGKGHE